MTGALQYDSTTTSPRCARRVFSPRAHLASLAPLACRQVIRWHEISLHFGWADVPRIGAALARLSAPEIARMQAGVRAAWDEHLRPDAARRTLFRLLEQRATFRF